MTAVHHLAELNIGRLRVPTDDPCVGNGWKPAAVVFTVVASLSGCAATTGDRGGAPSFHAVSVAGQDYRITHLPNEVELISVDSATGVQLSATDNKVVALAVEGVNAPLNERDRARATAAAQALCADFETSVCDAISLGTARTVFLAEGIVASGKVHRVWLFQHRVGGM